MKGRLPLVALFVLPLAGCSSENAAKGELERQGFSNITLERTDGQNFTFEASRDGNECTGTIEVQKGVGSSSSSVSTSCVAPGTTPAEAEMDAGAEAPAKEDAGEMIALEAMGPEFAYTPPADLQGRPLAKVSVKEASNIGAAAIAFLQATAAGDRPFLAANATEVLSTDLNANGFTDGIMLMRTLGEMTLELYDTKVHPGSIEIGYFHVEHTEGATKEPIDFELTLKDGKFHGFDLTGDSVAEAFKALDSAEPNLQLVSIHAFNDRAGIMPKVVLQEKEDVVIRFVFGGLAREEGKVEVSFHAETKHPDATEEKVKVDPTAFESPGLSNADVTLHDPADGTHHIDMTLTDERNQATKQASIDIVVEHGG